MTDSPPSPLLQTDRGQQEDYRFTRKDVRRHTGWSDFQVRTHLGKLAELEYVLVHHGSRGQSFVYELLYDGKGLDGRPFVMRLLDVGESDTDNEHPGADNEHGEGRNEGRSSPQRAPNGHPSRAAKKEGSVSEDNDLAASEARRPRNAHGGVSHTRSSYPHRADRSVPPTTTNR